MAAQVPDIIKKLDAMSEAERDELAFGVIQLNDEGYVVSFSRAEEQITGRKVQDVIGKHFFREVAPCTQSPRFLGRFLAGVREGKTDVSFEYVLDHEMRPTRVHVHLYKKEEHPHTWVVIRRLGFAV